MSQPPLEHCPAQPRIVADPMQIGGRVVDEFGGAPIAGADVELRDVIDGALVSRTATDLDGAYQVSLATAGVLPAVYRRASIAGYLDGYLFDGDVGSLPLPLLTRDAADALYRSVDLARDPSEGMMLVVLGDCDGAPVPGATIEVPGARRVLYMGADTHFDPELGETSRDSAAIVLGVPTGPARVFVERGGVVLEDTVAIESHADALTTRWFRP